MNIKTVLNNLVYYYDKTRVVGHTSFIVSALNTTRNFIKNKVLLLTHNKDFGTYLTKNYNLSSAVNNVSLYDVEKNNLDGYHLPLVVDNAALHTIFNSALTEINTLEQELRSTKAKLHGSSIMNEVYKIENNKLQTRVDSLHRELNLQMAKFQCVTDVVNHLHTTTSINSVNQVISDICSTVDCNAEVK